jgi:hypothetical protein
VGSDELLTISFDKISQSKLTVNITDLTGKMFMSKEFYVGDSQHIKIKDLQLESGMYLVNVQSGYNSLIKKLIVK